MLLLLLLCISNIAPIQSFTIIPKSSIRRSSLNFAGTDRQKYPSSSDTVHFSTNYHHIFDELQFRKSRSKKSYFSSSTTTMMMMTTAEPSLEKETKYDFSSLASSYVIRINEKIEDEIVWSLVPLQSPETEGVGTIAVKAVQSNEPTTLNEKDDECVARLHCNTEIDSATASISITIQNEKMMQKEDEELIPVLSRIMVQRAIDNLLSKVTTVTIDLPKEEKIILDTHKSETIASDEDKISRATILFSTVLPSSSTSSIEWVEMVDSKGTNMLGIVPRILVHKFNLLHRGIGVVVFSPPPQKEDDPILQLLKDDKKQTEVYVHRRTKTKRIFPSLYDMFVGGVSLAFEPSKLTAAREVAEEIGLSCALKVIEANSGNKKGEENTKILSNELFTCIICTSYNRCVVSVFTYTCLDFEKDTIEWQEEEVDWGGFVPYDIVEKSARLSIDRLKNGGTWPGTGMEEKEEGIAVVSLGDGTEESTIGKEDEWKTWDYVPDGLLVWEAWLKWTKNL